MLPKIQICKLYKFKKSIRVYGYVPNGINFIIINIIYFNLQSFKATLANTYVSEVSYHGITRTQDIASEFLVLSTILDIAINIIYSNIQPLLIPRITQT